MYIRFKIRRKYNNFITVLIFISGSNEKLTLKIRSRLEHTFRLAPAQKIAQGCAYKSNNKLERQQLMICHCLSNAEAYLQKFSFHSLTQKSILAITSFHQLLGFPHISVHLK